MAAEAGDIREVERNRRRFCVREGVSAVAFYQLRRKPDGDFAGRLTERSGAVRPPEEAPRFLPVRIETGELVEIELPIANDTVHRVAAGGGSKTKRNPGGRNSCATLCYAAMVFRIRFSIFRSVEQWIEVFQHVVRHDSEQVPFWCCHLRAIASRYDYRAGAL